MSIHIFIYRTFFISIYLPRKYGVCKVLGIQLTKINRILNKVLYIGTLRTSCGCLSDFRLVFGGGYEFYDVGGRLRMILEFIDILFYILYIAHCQLKKFTYKIHNK